MASRASSRMGTKSRWRKGESKVYGVKANRNVASTKANAERAKD